MAKQTATDIIDGLLNKLDIDESRLASMLAESVITIQDWHEQSTADLANRMGTG